MPRVRGDLAGHVERSVGQKGEEKHTEPAHMSTRSCICMHKSTEETRALSGRGHGADFGADERRCRRRVTRTRTLRTWKEVVGKGGSNARTYRYCNIFPEPRPSDSNGEPIGMRRAECVGRNASGLSVVSFGHELVDGPYSQTNPPWAAPDRHGRWPRQTLFLAAASERKVTRAGSWRWQWL